MKDVTESEVILRDEVALRLLVAIAPTVKGPETLKSAVPLCYDVAERFLVARRVVLKLDAAEEIPVSPLVQS